MRGIMNRQAIVKNGHGKSRFLAHFFELECLIVSKQWITNPLLLPLLISIIFFDSLNSYYPKKIAKKIRSWLNSQWKILRRAHEKPFNKTTMKVIFPKGKSLNLFLILMLYSNPNFFDLTPNNSPEAGQYCGLRGICMSVCL